MKKLILSGLLSYCSICCSLEDVSLSAAMQVKLLNPKYEKGALQTSEGGTLQGANFYLQAKTIKYTKSEENKETIHKVYAKDDLMLNYYGQIFLGDELEYDFEKRKGFLRNGRTQISIWFMKGEKICFFPDKTLEVYGASVTTSDGGKVEWEMKSKKLTLTKDQYLSSRAITVKFLDVPIFWIPGFKSNLKTFSDNPVRYSLKWDSGQGPKASMRYRIYSWKNFNTYLRLDYRYARGPGAAFEADFKSDDKRVRFKSKNYFANDTFYNDDDPNKKKKRFRLQGIFEGKTKNENAEILAQYDRISDKNMPGDFKSEDFELNTAKKTQARVRYFNPNYVTGFNVEPRINSFQGFKQELPEFKLSVKPLRIGNSPLYMENQLNLAFYDYVYSDDLRRAPIELQNVLSDFHSLRGETFQKVYLPLHFKGVHFTPYGAFNGIAYSDSPRRKSAYQGVFSYGASTFIRLYRHYTRFFHEVTPYIDFSGYSKPSVSSNNVYIFDIYDGYHRLNMVKTGLKQNFYQKGFNPFLPNLNLDLYTLGFFGDQTYRLPFPKAGVEGSYNIYNLEVGGHLQWNFNNHVLDVGNAYIGWTLNSYIAFNFEYRHRSKYYFRKDNYNNYIVETTRSIDNLLDSPMSDGRNTFLSRVEVKFSPTWSLQLQTHSGWGRRNERGYNGAKVDLYTMLTSSWRLRLSYLHTPRVDQFSFGIDLIRR